MDGRGRRPRAQTTVDDASTRWVEAASAALAFVFVVVFVVIAIQHRDLAAGHLSPPNELLLVVPTMPAKDEEQPVSRSFDQVAGMLAGLEDLGLRGESFAIRAEYIPTSTLDEPRLVALTRPSTRVLIGPGASTDIQRVFLQECTQPGCPLPSLPLLLISSTSTRLRPDLAKVYRKLLPAVTTNEDIASTMGEAISKWIERHPDEEVSIAIHSNETDLWYAAELHLQMYAELAERQLIPLLRRTSQPATIRVLIGNENWWLRGSRVALESAKLVILSDGLNSRAIVSNISGTFDARKTEIVCIKARTRDAIAAARLAWPHDASEWKHIGEPEFAWRNIARSAIRQVVSALVAGKPPVLSPVKFEAVSPCLPGDTHE